MYTIDTMTMRKRRRYARKVAKQIQVHAGLGFDDLMSAALPPEFVDP